MVRKNNTTLHTDMWRKLYCKLLCREIPFKGCVSVSARIVLSYAMSRRLSFAAWAVFGIAEFPSRLLMAFNMKFINGSSISYFFSSNVSWIIFSYKIRIKRCNQRSLRLEFRPVYRVGKIILFVSFLHTCDLLQHHFQQIMVSTTPLSGDDGQYNTTFSR
jgi:hypothetical protein